MKIIIHIDGKEKSVPAGLVPVSRLYELADCGGNKRLFLNREDGIDIPILPEEYMLVHGGENFVTGESPIEDNPPLRSGVQPEFNGARNVSLPTAKIIGKALKARDDQFPQGRLFADIEDGVDVEIPDDMTIVVQNKDSYFVIPGSADSDGPVDIEECGKHERRPPKGGSYRIRIDGDKHVVESAKITGTAVLALVGKSFDEWKLNQKLHGGKRENIGPDSEVDLTHPGIERFESVRTHAQQGDQEPFELPLEDIEYLDGNYPDKWEKISEGNGKFGLLVKDFPIPGGYAVEKSTLMLLVPSGYPGSQVDMFYFDPPLEKSNGQSIDSVGPEVHFDRTWQRWSRHYDWIAGTHSIVTHIEYIKNEITNVIE